jgi:transcriptional regulator with XRE-family HTH domain
MVIGDRLKDLRESKNMSQGEIEKRTGLLRCYISRVENGHTVPTIETLEKMARALEVPLYQLFYDAEPSAAMKPLKVAAGWGSTGRDARTLDKFRRLLRRTSAGNMKLLLSMAHKMSQNKADRGRKEQAQLVQIYDRGPMIRQENLNIPNRDPEEPATATRLPSAALLNLGKSHRSD